MRNAKPYRASGGNLSVRLPIPLLAKLQKKAQEEGTSRSEVIRGALEFYFSNGGRQPKVSCYDLTRHLCGIIKGFPDSATNPKYMQGFGE